jgi:23S rRNA (uracil1939-C5)-methyltransferase
MAGTKKYKPGDVLDVKIEKIVPKGLGLAFAEGLTVFVPLTAAGDRVRARIGKLKGNAAFCEIEEVLEPGPERHKPPCPYFGACGGCDLQQITYEAQLRAKVGIVRDCLERIGKFRDIGEIPIVASSEPLGYRLRAQWHAETAGRAIGYFRRETHEVIDVDHCPIATPELNAALSGLRAKIPWETIWSNRIAIDAAHGDGDVVSVYADELVEPTVDVAMRVLDDEYAFSARTFFQGNKYLVGKLVELATDGSSGRHAVDLYSGVGLFSLPLARKFERVTAVEANGLAVEYAKRNAATAGLRNIEFLSVEVEDLLRGHSLEDVDLVIFDPPRSGTSKETVLRTMELRAPVISYVSCEPSILARDLRWMVDGGYAIESVTAVDLFPQTHHVETVVRLRAEIRP